MTEVIIMLDQDTNPMDHIKEQSQRQEREEKIIPLKEGTKFTIEKSTMFVNQEDPIPREANYIRKERLFI